jgi:hypothetical protein
VDEHLLPYFAAEKREALLFMLVGIAAIAVAVMLLARRHRYRGMAYPLITIALIQLTVGAAVYFRTDDQVAALQAQYRQDPAAFKADEQRRMETVVRNFDAYKVIEIALLVAGLATALTLRRRALWQAVGVGLVLEAALMLVLDLFAEQRADEYLKFVLAT